MTTFAEVKPRQIIEAHCNACGPARDHEVLAEEKSYWEAEGGAVTGGETHSMIKCRGCKAISVRISSWCSEDDGPSIRQYPPRVSRKQPEWVDDLILEDGELAELLNEIYVALQNDLRAVAAMGVRALLERIMIAKVGDSGSFRAHLDRFRDAGHISNLQRERVDAILEAGHAAMHRTFRPSAEDINTLIDIAEHVIESVYLHDSKIAALRKRIPARAPKPAGKKPLRGKKLL